MAVDYALKNGLRAEAVKAASARPDIDRSVWYEVILVAGGKTFEIKTLDSIRIIRDFNSKVTDIIKVVLTMQMGDYIQDVKPNKNDLTLKLTHHTPGLISTDEYKFIIALEDKNIASDGIKGTKEDLNNSLTTIHGECVDKVFLMLKQKSKAETFEDTSLEGAMCFIMDKAIGEATSKFGVGKDFINVVEPDNPRPFKNLVVPSTTSVITLPILMQEKMGGLYNGSINSYFYRQNNTFKSYVFPLYRSNLLNTIGKKLIIVAGVDIMTAVVDSTYSIDQGGDLRILVLQKEKMDDDNVDMLTKGGGVKGIDVNTVRGRPVSIGLDGVEVKATSLFRKMHEETADELSSIINVKPTDNFYETRTKVLKNKLVKVTVEWNHSNARYIYPYMPVIYLEEHEGETVMREGMVNGLDIFTQSKAETTVISVLITAKEKGGSKQIKLF